ncbi:hypothetical protein PYCCODRAFT_1465654 [Trametes coccinea BRFM310]|uniref:Uncharacterized protein n=1 Tax=Trametes coccinea (strain BRFM310) TaxID=1353009 RepID=A0A1Y2IZ43_TRAC3|nr:hypothetical protein PYCCODRAFT_1465654 [Trametes coccinea BRFM310]
MPPSSFEYSLIGLKAGNPYLEVLRDEHGRPVLGSDGDYCVTESSHRLQRRALEKFCQLYPPMTHLPEQLPPELWNPIFSDKGGYLLHYGFKITKEQANECLVRLELKRSIKSRVLDVAIICDYINSNTEGFSGFEVDVEAIADPDLFETKVVTLYSNLREGLDWFRRPYDEDRKRQVIDRVAEVLSPFTQQTEPFWYWDVFHSPDFQLDWSKSDPPAWDVTAE